MILVLATANKDKGKEISSILGALPGVNLRLLSDYPHITLPPETGLTYRENAQIKATTVAKVTGEWALGDDSGLEIAALDDAPGLYSARYAGENVTYADNRKKVLALLKGVPDEKRQARFICTIVISDPDGNVEVAEGICPGKINLAETGDGGFGYDPIFYLPQYGKTFSELTQDEKNKVSHRGAALRAAIAILKKR
jgi:XTP/dITP diphosphohydrolase